MSASPAASTPVGVSPSESHDDEAIRPLSTAAPLRFAAGNGLAADGNPTTAPVSGEEVSPHPDLLWYHGKTIAQSACLDRAQMAPVTSESRLVAGHQ